MKSRDVAKAVVLTALAVALSPVFIPVGIAKCFPAQHMVNVLAAVMLGPVYAMAVAGLAAVIRNILGLGTLLAFPGGMIGAFVAGLAYLATRRTIAAGLGEVVGTGLLGALASAWLVAPVLMNKTMPLAALVIAFSISTIGGTIIGLLALSLLKKAGIWKP